MTWYLIGVLLVLLLVLYHRWDSRQREYRLFNPSIQTNNTIPAKQAREVLVAIEEGRPAVFHGGCLGCIFRHQNTTHTGLAFCRGCRYFAFNQSLPDRSITDYELSLID